MKEREINLLDLFVEILLHWRGMIAAMLLGGILLGGISVGHQRAAVEVQIQPWEAVDDAQRMNVHEAVVLMEQYKQSLEYHQKSPLMRLNPLHIQRADLLLAVRADSYRKAYVLAQIYGILLGDVALYEYVEDQCHIEGGVNELISLKGGLSNEQYDAGDKRVAGEAQAVVLVGRAQILYDDKDVSNAMADAVMDFLRGRQKNLEQEFGGHELMLLSRSQGEVMERGIVDCIRLTTDNYNDIREQYTTILQSFTDKEMAYYRYLTEGTPGNTAQQDSGEATVGGQTGISVRYVLLGAGLSTLLYAFSVFLKYILNSKICGTDSLQELYGIRHLGTVPAALRKKRFLDGADQWILRLSHCGRRKFTREEAIRLAVAATKMAAMKDGAGTVCCLGCGLQGSSLAVCEQIKVQLEAADIRVEILNNVLYDAEEMARLESIGSAVLVETAGVTLYDEICRELELLQRQGITVLGGIVTG